ncbi:Golgi-associated plant pathogenesis-related protein 1-like [Oppia nitens]|uniref:Golgi-associated plant pathogenesis-related protein 1-like n=1 Tax=Oppia nitens TaxID=1686743 RepID=UPI0023DC3BCB|nr:Golgi-associated plant pathogenesis-related protein 1-like [Oppia nitens]
MYLSVIKILLLSLVIYCVRADIEDHSDELEDVIIKEHNALRKFHRVSPLEKITDNQYTRNRCKAKVGHPLSFSPPGADPKYGENVYRMNGKDLDYKKVADLVVLSWSKSKKTYNWKDLNPKSTYFSFTQMIWKDTKKITCAICGQKTDKIEATIVCNYLPPGNVKKQYKENVFESMGKTAYEIEKSFIQEDYDYYSKGEVISKG